MTKNESVIAISIYFFKAFDSQYAAVSDALLGLDMPDSIYKRFVEYLADRRHYTSFEGRTSTETSISASVVPESVLCPFECIIGTADLQPVSSQNRTMVYAEDSYLLVGSRNVIIILSVRDELGNTPSITVGTHVHLNPAKTHEMVVIRTNMPSMHAAAPPIAGSSRNSSMQGRQSGLKIGGRGSGFKI